LGFTDKEVLMNNAAEAGAFPKAVYSNQENL
jgi:hypothetical protein